MSTFCKYVITYQGQLYFSRNTNFLLFLRIRRMLTYCSKYVMEVCLFVYYVLFMCVKSSVSATRQHQINESSLKKLWWLNNSLLASTFFFYRSHNLFSSFKSRLSERMSCKESPHFFQNTFANISHRS